MNEIDYGYGHSEDDADRWAKEEMSKMPTKSKTSKTAIYQYKCRMCGRTFDSSTESSGDTDIVDRVLVNSIYRTANISERVPMQVVHWCKDGNFGIADLAGARIVKDQ